MSAPFALCPFCKQELHVDAGGFAYMRSQVVEHMSRCAERPADLPKEDFWAAVEQATPHEHE